MPQARLKALVEYCDRLLDTRRVQDYERAANGLQVENRGQVRRMAAAVDASLATVRLAVAAKASLLLVHHGLFWSAAHPWTGRRLELIRCLIENDLAVYSSHLPLDAHPKVGNSAQLASALGLKRLRPFFVVHGRAIGFQGRDRVPRTELGVRLSRVTGAEARVIPGGPEVCRRIGVVTGAAGAEVKQAVEEGVDTLVTGEGPHWTYALAEELGVNVLYGGHYATETFGVKALAEHLSRRFRIPWIFVDYPTGL